MGYYTTGTLQKKSITLGATYPDSKRFIDFITDTICGADSSDPCDPGDTSTYPGAGWTRVQSITAQITFTALAITEHVVITLNGTKFEFVASGHTPIHGGIPVPLGADNDSSLTALGATVLGAMQWEFSRPTTGSITFFKTTDPKICNGLVCTVSPSGSVGIWDTSTGVAGEGFTWRGGYLVRSDKVSFGATPLTLKIMSYGNGSFIMVSDINEVFIFDGLQTNNSWELIASKYQFILRVPTKDTSGTCLVASHMKPLSNSIYCNFVFGPTGPIVGTSGGDRQSLQNVNGMYYAEWNGFAYGATQGSGTSNQRPAFCFPGMGFGIANVDKLANKIGGLDLKKDDGTFFPYEAMLAFCDKNPSLGGAVFGIRGAFWDSVIYPTYAAVESSANINGKSGIVLMGQAGTQFSSRGIFVTRTN